MLLGTLIGVLPGIGPVPTIAMLLPITYALPPVSALIMLAGIYYGAQYGGSTTAILVNLPGEASSVVTCLDGYQMARKGQAGAALAIAALGSFFAGTFATLLVAAFAPPLAEVALKFGPAEYFSLMVLGLIAAVVLAQRLAAQGDRDDRARACCSASSAPTSTPALRASRFGIPELSDGIGFVVVAMGLFGFAEIIVNLEHTEKREVVTEQGLGPLAQVERVQGGAARDRCAAPASARCSASCRAAARCSPRSRPTRSRRRSPRTRRTSARARSRASPGPRAANNAGAQTSFIPLLTLGIPPNAVMALMVGAMTIHNIQPGPQVMTSNPQLFWGLIVSMWIGNLMLVVLNLPLIGIWIKLLQVPYRLLYPAILLFCCIGVYSINNNVFDVLHDRALRRARLALRQARVRAGAAAARASCSGR